MNFLSNFLTNPFLAIGGAVLGSVPIIIHILNRTFYNTMDWAAMDFLLRAEQKTRRRVQLENLLLMILRYLLLALLGLALAQPFMEDTPLSIMGTQKKHFVLVLDNSYSMKKKQPNDDRTLYASVRDRAVNLLQTKFNPANGDKVSILTASAYPRKLIGTPSQNRSRAVQLVKNSGPSAYHGGLLASLQQVEQTLEKTDPAKINRKIIWFTDVQKNTWLPDNKSIRSKIKKTIERINETVDQFVLMDAGADETANVGVVDLQTDDQFMVRNRPINVSATLRNFSRVDRSGTVTLFRDDDKIESLDVNLQPGESVQREFQPIRFQETGPHSIHASFDTDRLATDNQRFIASNIKKDINVLIVDGEPEDKDASKSESYFIESALSPDDRSTPFDLKVVSDYLFRDHSLDEFDLVMLTNLSNFSASRRKELRQYVKRGGGVLFFLGDQTTLKTFNKTLYDVEEPILPGKLEKIQRRSIDKGNFVRLTDLKTDHPALRFFQPYEEKLKQLFTHGWIRMVIPDDAVDVRVLARFDDGSSSPAIVERSIGRGKIITIPTSSDLDWNLWPEMQGFVMLVDQLSRYLLSQKQQSMNVTVGDELNLPISGRDTGKQFRIATPEQEISNKTPRPLRDGGYVLTMKSLNHPGIYDVEKETEDGTDWTLDQTVAANPVPREGNLLPASEERIKQAYSGLMFQSFSKTEEPDKDVATSDLWMYVAGLVLLLIVLESLLALKIDRGRQVS